MTTARPLGRRVTRVSVLVTTTVVLGLILAVTAGAGTKPGRAAAGPRLTSAASGPKALSASCSGGAITINDAGPATPYPSTCVVSGLSGSVSDVNMDLTGLSHTYPDDVDMLLVSPGGQNAIVFSDAGGSTDLVNCNVTLDDQAPAVLPDTTISCPGNYQPANYEPGDPFPAPAPAPSGSVALSTFNGGTPNGTWSLYVQDDAGIDVGTITGWSLTVIAEGPPPPPPPPPPATASPSTAAPATSSTPTGRALRPVRQRCCAFVELPELRGLEQLVRRRARRRLRGPGRSGLEHRGGRGRRRVLQRPGPREQRERELLFERRQQPAGLAASVAPEPDVHERPELLDPAQPDRLARSGDVLGLRPGQSEPHSAGSVGLA